MPMCLRISKPSKDTHGQQHVVTAILKNERRAPRHSGLKEFADHVIIAMGRDQVKPTTECLRGVATYPKEDMTPGKEVVA